MPKDAEITKIAEEEDQVDGKALAIKLAAMAVVTTAAIWLTNKAVDKINESHKD